MTFGNAVIRGRWWIIAFSLTFLVATASGTRFLTSTSNMRVFFSEKNPQLMALEAFEDTYTKDETILFVIEPKDGSVFTRPTLAAVEGLTEAAW